MPKRIASKTINIMVTVKIKCTDPEGFKTVLDFENNDLAELGIECETEIERALDGKYDGEAKVESVNCTFSLRVRIGESVR